MMIDSRFAWLGVCIAIALMVISASAASAAETGAAALPWDTPLTTLKNSITGPVVQLLIAVAIVIAGAVWFFADVSQGGAAVIRVVVGGSIILGAAGVANAFFGTDIAALF